MKTRVWTSVAIAVAGSLAAGTACAGSLFAQSSYDSSLTLYSNNGYPAGTNGYPAGFAPSWPNVGVAYANGSYYALYGGGPEYSGSQSIPPAQNAPIVQLNSAGVITSGPTPVVLHDPTKAGNPVISPLGLNFTSIFSDAQGNIYTVGGGDVLGLPTTAGYTTTISKQTSLGQFTAGTLIQSRDIFDGNGKIVLNSTGTGFVGHYNGRLEFWDLAGNETGTLALGACGCYATNTFPSDVQTAINGDYLLDYAPSSTPGADGILYAFSLNTGELVDQTTLKGAGTGYDSLYGSSYANGYFFVADSRDANILGYQIGSFGVPEPTTWTMLILGMGAMGLALRRRRHGGFVSA